MSIVITTPDRKPEAFVLSCWLRSYAPRGCRVHGLDYDDQRGRSAYFKTHHPELTRLLRSSTLALASLEGEPDVYVGWALGMPERGVLHYVFVKSLSRHYGVARELVRVAAGEEPRIYTFEPSARNGTAHKQLIETAARKGMRFHPHPIPGMAAHKQREERA